MSESIYQKPRKILRPTPVNFYRLSQAESWLGQMARKGWMLTGAGNIFCTFEQQQPAEYRYRLEPRGQSDPDKEFIELCALDGWEYVTSWQETFTIWRAKGDQTPEFHTDPVAQSYAFQKLSRRMGREAVSSLCLSAVIIAAIIWLLAQGQMVRMMVEGELLFQAPIWVLGLWVDLLNLLNWRAIRKLTRQLKNGESLSHDVPVRKKPWWLFHLSLILVVILCLALSLSTVGQQRRTSADRLTEPLPLPRLTELETGQLQPEGYAAPNALSIDRSPLAPVQYILTEQGEWNQEAYDSWRDQGMPMGEFPITYRASYYQLRPRFLTRPLLREMAQQLQKQADGLEWTSVSDPRAEVIWYGSLPSQVQYLLVGLGNQAVCIEYRGSEELLERMDIILQKMETVS